MLVGGGGFGISGWWCNWGFGLVMYWWSLVGGGGGSVFFCFFCLFWDRVKFYE